ncbi:MAG: helix-turn-helix domain-containing protein [Carbonactinosporaceae bacterium]
MDRSRDGHPTPSRGLLSWGGLTGVVPEDGGGRCGKVRVMGAGESDLGARLREARLAQRRTLAEVAATTGLTKGFLSKLENAQAGASVASLVRLCEALGLPVGALFEPAVGAVVRRGGYPAIDFGGEAMREFLLTPRHERRVQTILSEIEPGGGSGPDRYTLPTDVEFVFVLDGHLEVDLAGQPVTLAAGDALTFTAGIEHTFRATGDRTARVLWILTPALPDRADQRHHERERR